MSVLLLTATFWLFADFCHGQISSGLLSRLDSYLLWLRKSLKCRQFPYYFQQDNGHLSTLWLLYLWKEIEKDLNNGLVSWVKKSEDGSKAWTGRIHLFTQLYSIYFLPQLPSVMSAWHVIATQWMMVMISELSRFEDISIQPVLRVTVSPAFPQTVHLFLCKMTCLFILKIILFRL